MIKNRKNSKTGAKSIPKTSAAFRPPPITENPALRDDKAIELNEEWANFMVRVGEVSSLVKDMASGDKAKSEAASKRADLLLAGKVLDENVEATIKTNRTVINKQAFKTMGNNNADEMDKEVWMSEVSKDAEKRAQDRKVRKEKADTQNTMATKAFRRGDYEKALSCYNKAIDHIRDNPMYYCDRALTNIKLKNYEKVDKDCDSALRLNESSYKARLYRVKAHFELETEQFQEYRQELLESFPQHEDLTVYFLKKDEQDTSEEEEDEED